MSQVSDNEEFARLVQVWLRKRGAYQGRVDGWAGSKTQAAFEGLVQPSTEAAWIGHGFLGDLDWLHDQEGHKGWPYWPGGASGVTLDPGLDLGYSNSETVSAVYGAAVAAACKPAFGLRGAAASRLAADRSLPLAQVRVSRAQAREALPVVARPYWIQISKRFPGLRDAPAPVQTAMLSLAYNRGPWNSEIEVCADSIARSDWGALADVVGGREGRGGARIGGMQQTHQLGGIRHRRREEGDLIRTAA